MGTVTYDFGGETVVVTGGASGIGRAIATRFGDAGATVLVADVRETPKDTGERLPTHERIRDRGGEAEYVEADVSDPDAIAALVEAAREYGGVDVMVNNAALPGDAGLLELDAATVDRLLGVNVRGVLFGVQAAAADMLDREDPGVILNTASISSNEAQHDQIHYDATKGAVRMITRGAALELGDHGIRVNAVAPGQIATEFADGWTEEATRGAREDDLLKPVPLGREGRPVDVAGAALYLASDDADYVTGELLHVDGGWQTC